MTSTLQQEASRKLRFTAQTTMSLAQRLYENGYITYMRTDSTTLSESALTAARSQATALFGADFVPDAPRRYERKVKNAQEAHEAIRPAGDSFRTPQEVQRELSRDEHALYELIWMRTIASQMKDAQGQTVSMRIGGDVLGGAKRSSSRASGTVITFRGFLAAYEEARDDDRSAAPEDEERRLPKLAEGDAVDLKELEPQGHETNPPARYTEATLVRTLEELGIGRPSTYASIISTILDRGYVSKRGGALVPSFLAFSVVGLLEQHFERLRRLRVHRLDGGRPRPHRGRRRGPQRLASPLLLRGRRARPRRARSGPRRDRREGGQQHPAAGQRHHDSRRPVRRVPRARRAAGEHPRGRHPRRADRRAGRGAPCRAVRRARARRRSGDRPAWSSRAPAATART